MDGLVDSTSLGKWLNALDVNPSVARLEKFGVAKKVGKCHRSTFSIRPNTALFTDEKKFKLDELLPIFSELKKERKDQGCYEDFIECLKLYDKAENGKVAVGELSHSLLSLGNCRMSFIFKVDFVSFRRKVNGPPSGRGVRGLSG